MDQALMKKVEATVEKAAEASSSFLEKMGIDPEIYARAGLNAIMHQPEIANCTLPSIRFVLLKCAQRGMMPDGESAAIVPRRIKGKLVATLIPMVGGQTDLVRDAIPGISIVSGIVRKGDEFEYHEELKTHFFHKPSEEPKFGADNVRAAYAKIWCPGAMQPEITVMFKAEIEQVKSRSRAKQGPWFTDYEEMAKKTVLRRVFKRLPIRQGLQKQNRQPIPVDAFDEFTPEDAIEVPAQQVEQQQRPAAPAQTQTRTEQQPQQRAPAHVQEEIPADASGDGYNPDIPF